MTPIVWPDPRDVQRWMWSTICDTACQALIHGISYRDAVDLILSKPLDWERPIRK